MSDKYLNLDGLTKYDELLKKDTKMFYTTASATENAFTVDIPYIKSEEDLVNGLSINVRFNAATASGATLNVSGTGAVPIYYRTGTAITTHIVANNYCILVYYVSGTTKRWVLNFAYDANTNTIGYQLRTNSSLWANKTYNGSTGYSMNRYTLLFEVNGGLSGAATTIATGTSKVTIPFKYIPGGVIKYYSTNGAIAINANFGATGLWDQYTLDLRYTFNTGSTLVSGKPVYVKMSINDDGTISPVYSGSPSHPVVQTLPSTEDGYVYLYLGQAYSTTSMELYNNHPIYEYKGGQIKLWAGKIGDIPTKTSDLINDSGFITGIDSSDVTDALGYTPYNSSNPNNYTSVVESTVSNWGFTKNQGTVTEVSAGTGLVIAEDETVNPQVCIDTGYKLPTTTEWSNIPQGTVTSVGVGTGLSISGTETVNPTVNVDSNYKLPTTTEWNSKANTSALASYIPYSGVLMPTNPFGGKRLYINSLDNAFASADKKLWVTITKHKISDSGKTYPYVDTTKTITDDNYYVDGPVVSTLTSSAHSLFNGSYEDNITCDADGSTYLKIRIMFGSNTSPSASTSYFTGYPYGDYYLSFYYNNTPNKNSQLRVYNKYAAHTVGWHLYESSWYSGSASQANVIQKFTDNNDYQRTCVDFIIYGNTASGRTVAITQIDYQLSRPNLSRDGSTVTKYDNQNLYFNFTWNDNHTEKTRIGSNGLWASNLYVLDYDAIKKVSSIGGTTATYTYTLPEKTGTFAMMSDVPAAVTEAIVAGWGFTKNAGTVTSVQVQAGTGLSSSQSSAQSTTLNTTISVASGYKLPTTTEWNSKGTYSKPSGGIPASDLAESYYLASNPNNYISGITSSMITTALGYTPGTSNFTGYTSSNKLSTDYINNEAGWTSVTESTVSSWGFTKNTGDVTTNTTQTISGAKTFSATDTIISGCGFSTTNNLLNNTSVYACMRGNNSNPLFGLKVGSAKYYLQATSNGLYLGPTSSVATSWDANGNVTMRGTNRPKWGSNNIAITSDIPSDIVTLSASQALTNKTYNGYTLGAACAKAIASSISSSDTGLATAQQVYNALSSAGGPVEANFLYDAEEGDFVSTITQAQFETIENAGSISYLDEANMRYVLYTKEKWTDGNQHEHITFVEIPISKSSTTLELEFNGTNASVTVTYTNLGSKFYEHNIIIKQQNSTELAGMITTKLVNNSSTVINTPALLWSALDSAGYGWTSDTIYPLNSSAILSASGFSSTNTIIGIIALLNSPKIAVLQKSNTATSLAFSSPLPLVTAASQNVYVSDFIRILS